VEKRQEGASVLEETGDRDLSFSEKEAVANH
jgi:hypothetical protein